MKYHFSGPLARFIEQYFEVQRSLGIEQPRVGYTLAAFDRHLINHFPQARTVTRSMVVDFLDTTRHVHVNTRRQRLRNIRQFCQFLFHLDGESYIPDSRLLPPLQRTSFHPYLYRVNDVITPMQLARRLKPVYPLRAESVETIIGLLWATGMRIGEVLRLNLADVDLKEGLLQIKQTKFHKSRLVPISRSTVSALSFYMELRMQRMYETHPTAPFFVCVKGRRWLYWCFGYIFRRLVRQAGFKSKWGTLPRLHDLRHSFATRSLARMYEPGKDPTIYLPSLATYLGHTRVAYTSLYLHPQIDLLEIAGRRFKAHVGSAIDLSLGGEQHEDQ